MKIFINMISLFSGGPKTVGFGFLEGIRKNSNHTWIILLPRNNGYEDYIQQIDIKYNKKVTIIFACYPTYIFKPILKFYYDQIFTSFFYYFKNINIVFMTGNFSCWFINHKHQLILQHNASYLQKYSSKHHGGKFKYFLGKCLMTISIFPKPRLIVQLQCIKSKFISQFKYPYNLIKVVTMVPLPRYLNLTKNIESFSILKKISYNDVSLKLFFPANYYPGKNHKILIPLAEIIKAYNYKIVIFVTLPYDCEFLSEVKLKNLDKIIINLGYINNQIINLVYQSVNYLFFPSYVESYGMPYVEALQNGIPIITADYDFSREICGDSAIYFEQDCIESLHQAICLAMDDQIFKMVKDSVMQSKSRFQHNWNSIIDEIFPMSI